MIEILGVEGRWVGDTPTTCGAAVMADPTHVWNSLSRAGTPRVLMDVATRNSCVLFASPMPVEQDAPFFVLGVRDDYLPFYPVPDGLPPSRIKNEKGRAFYVFAHFSDFSSYNETCTDRLLLAVSRLRTTHPAIALLLARHAHTMNPHHPRASSAYRALVVRARC